VSKFWRHRPCSWTTIREGHSAIRAAGRSSRWPSELRKLEHDVRLSSRDWGFEAVEKLVVLMRGVITVEIDKSALKCSFHR